MVVINGIKYASGELFGLNQKTRRGCLTLSTSDVQALRKNAPNFSLVELSAFRLEYGQNFDQPMVEFTSDGMQPFEIIW